MFHKPNHSNPNTIRKQILTTRLYLTVLSISLCIMATYTTLEETVHQETIKNPSLSIFEHLGKLYPDAVQCSCSHISFPNSDFLNVNATLHSVCASYFVSNEWIKVNTNSPWLNYANGPVLFYRLLNLFCLQAHSAINEAVVHFLSDAFIVTEPLTRIEFNLAIHSLLLNLQTSLPISFIRTLQIVRDTTHGNALFNTFTTNWFFEKSPIGAHTLPILSRPVDFSDEDCSCATTSSCMQKTYFNWSTYERIIDGVITGCSPLESFLRSTLECIYDQDCLDFMCFISFRLFRPGVSRFSNVSVLGMNSSKRFSPQTKIESILNVMMIDEWSNSSSYEQFYNACAPALCTYSYTAKSNFFYVINLLIAQYGGLKVTLTFLIPLIINAGWRVQERFFIFQRQIDPEQ